MNDEKAHFLVLFGPPGSGKSEAGKIFQSEHGFHYEDLDQYHTHEQNRAKQLNEPFTEGMRIKFFEKVYAVIDELNHDQKRRLIVDNAFINERFRKEFQDRYPKAIFILVEGNKETRIQRIHQRKGHSVSTENAIRMGEGFEEIGISHQILDNNSDMKALRKNIANLLEKNDIK
jgi:gluconate kinase